MRCITRQQHLSGTHGHTAAQQRILENVIHGVGEKPATMWATDQRSVLSDDGVELLVDVGDPMAKLAEGLDR